jgi:hypothetical protein
MRLFLIILSGLFVLSADQCHTQVLKIQPGESTLRKMASRPEARTAIRTVIFKGEFGKRKLRRMMNMLGEFPAINEVRFAEHGLIFLPKELNACMTLQRLVVDGHDGFDVDSALALCSALPQLKEVYIGLSGIVDYPDVPAGLSGLDTLYFFGPDVSIGHSESPLKPLPDSYSIDRYDEDLSQSLLSAEVLPVICMFPREEIAAAPSWTFQANTAAAGIIGLYAGIQKAEAGSIVPETIRKYNHVRPPAPDWVSSHESATINPEAVNVIELSTSQSRIVIPENAFVDSEGNTVTEPVTIYFKEYRDPLDFVLSGIPMSFISDSSVSYFSSAGMFDIQGFSSGKEVYVADGKTIDVSFESTTDADGFNFWRFDDSSGQWQDLGVSDAGVDNITEEDEKLLMTRAQIHFAQLYRSISRHSDPTPLHQRFESDQYTYTRRERKEKTHRLPVRDGSVKIDRLVRLKRVHYQGKNRDVLFSLNSFAGYHPELMVFRRCEWQLQDGMSTSEFRKLYAGRSKYSDVRLVNHGNYIEIRLKKGDEFISVNALPVLVKGKGEEAELTSELNRYSVYAKRLARREKQFNKRALKNLNIHDRIPVNDPKWKAELCYAGVRRFMKPEERALSMDQWIDAYYTTRAMYAASALSAPASGSEMVRMLSLSGFGLYNVDIMSKLERPITVLADYKTKDQPVEVTTAYALSLANNSMIMFDGYLGFSPHRIMIDTEFTDCLLTVNRDLSISVVTKEELKSKLESEARYVCFDAQHFDIEKNTTADVKEALGMR